MLKKILITSAVLLSTANVANAFEGPYFGGGIGIIVNTLSDTNNKTYYKHGFVTKNVIGASYRAVPVNVFAGFGAMINENFTAAFELSGTIGSFEITDNGDLLKTTYGFGASVLPGVMLSDRTVLFGRAGVVRTKFKEDDSKTGGIFGVGLQTAVTQNLDIRGEYDFTAYRSGGSFDHNPRTDGFNLSLIYNVY